MRNHALRMKISVEKIVEKHSHVRVKIDCNHWELIGYFLVLEMNFFPSRTSYADLVLQVSPPQTSVTSHKGVEDNNNNNLGGSPQFQ